MESLQHILLVQVTLQANQVLLTPPHCGGGGGGGWSRGTWRPGTGGEGRLGGSTDTVLALVLYLTGGQQVALVLVMCEVTTASRGDAMVLAGLCHVLPGESHDVVLAEDTRDGLELVTALLSRGRAQQQGEGNKVHRGHDRHPSEM